MLQNEKSFSDVDESKERCEAFLAEMKKRYPEGSWYYSLQSLLDANNDLYDMHLQIKDVWETIYGRSLNDSLAEYGIICTEEKAETQWNRVISRINKSKKRELPTSVKKLITPIPDINERVLDKLANDVFGISAKEKLIEMGLIESSNDHERDYLKVDLSSLKDNSDRYTTKKIQPLRRFTYTVEENDTLVSATIRGFGIQISEVVSNEYRNKMTVYKTNTPDVYEFYEGDPDKIELLIKKYPELKVVAFMQEWDPIEGRSASVVMSEPGYDHIMVKDFISWIDPYNESPYIIGHRPTDDFRTVEEFMDTGYEEKVNYKFPFRKEWNGFNYVFKKNDGFYAVTGVNLSNDVTKLYEQAYVYSEHLEKITLSASVQTIDARTFEGCEKLTKPEIDAENTNLEWVGDCMISRKTGIILLAWDKAEIPTDQRIKGIGSYVYMKLRVSELTIPDNILYIGDNAFKDCKKLNQVIILGDQPVMTPLAFNGCKKIDESAIQSVKRDGSF